MREKVVCSLMLTDRYLELIDAYRHDKDLSRSHVVRQALETYFSKKVEDKKVNKNEESRSEK